MGPERIAVPVARSLFLFLILDNTTVKRSNKVARRGAGDKELRLDPGATSRKCIRARRACNKVTLRLCPKRRSSSATVVISKLSAYYFRLSNTVRRVLELRSPSVNLSRREREREKEKTWSIFIWRQRY